MKRAYSKDMRQLALSKRESGMTVKEISESINVSVRAIFSWIRDFKTKNKIEPLSYSMRKKGKFCKLRQIQNEKKFEEFIKINNFLTHQQLADKWNKENNANVTKYGVGSAIKRIGYTFKRSTKTYKEADENKRFQFNEKLEDLKKNHNRNNVFF